MPKLGRWIATILIITRNSGIDLVSVWCVTSLIQWLVRLFGHYPTPQGQSLCTASRDSQ